MKFSIDSNSVEGSAEMVTSFDISTSRFQPTNAYKTRVQFTSGESAHTICVCVHSKETNCDVIQIWRAAALNPNSFMEISKEAAACVLVREIECPSALSELAVPKSLLEYKDFLTIGGEALRNGVGDFSVTNLAPMLHIAVAFQNGTFGFVNMSDIEMTGNAEKEIEFSSPVPNRTNHQGFYVQLLNLYF